NRKTCSTGLSKTRAIFSASMVEGTYLLLSMALMVWRDTPTRSASSACVMLRMARSTRIVLIMAIRFTAFKKKDSIEADDKEQERGGHIVGHYLQEKPVVEKNNRYHDQDHIDQYGPE